MPQTRCKVYLHTNEDAITGIIVKRVLISIGKYNVSNKRVEPIWPTGAHVVDGW